MKKIVIIVLMIALCMTLLVACNQAPEDLPEDTSWYDSSLTTLKISNKDQLTEFAKIVNGTHSSIAKDNFLGKTVTLDADIDLSDMEWTPIGAGNTSSTPNRMEYTNSDYSFKGNFDGQNHTISSMTITKAQNFAGLFGSVYSETGVADKDTVGISASNIKNFILADVNITNNQLRPTLYDENVPENPKNTNNLGVYLNQYYVSTGAVAGAVSNVKISGITVSGNIVGGINVGGIVGNANFDFNNEITDCTNNANVQGVNNVSGISTAISGLTLTNVTNNGEIVASIEASGIVSAAESANGEIVCTNVINNGNVFAYLKASGIFHDATVANNIINVSGAVNNGDITVLEYSDEKMQLNDHLKTYIQNRTGSWMAIAQANEGTGKATVKASIANIVTNISPIEETSPLFNKLFSNIISLADESKLSLIGSITLPQGINIAIESNATLTFDGDITMSNNLIYSHKGNTYTQVIFSGETRLLGTGTFSIISTVPKESHLTVDGDITLINYDMKVIEGAFITVNKDKTLNIDEKATVTNYSNNFMNSGTIAVSSLAKFLTYGNITNIANISGILEISNLNKVQPIIKNTGTIKMLKLTLHAIIEGTIGDVDYTTDRYITVKAGTSLKITGTPTNKGNIDTSGELIISSAIPSSITLRGKSGGTIEFTDEGSITVDVFYATSTDRKTSPVEKNTKYYFVSNAKWVKVI